MELTAREEIDAVRNARLEIIKLREEATRLKEENGLLSRRLNGSKEDEREAREMYDDLFETALRQLPGKNFNELLCEKCEDAPRYTERFTVCRKCTPVEDDRDGEY